jgi:hypothetical protein
MITLKEISEYALNSMSHYTPTNLNEYPYDMDGHCGDGLWKEIQEFWEDFNTNDDFKFVVSGEFMSDELDLGGGRSYLLSDDKLLDMLFDYMYNTLGWSLSDYQDKMHNSLDITDELEDRYNNISVVRDTKISSVLDKDLVSKSVESRILFNSILKDNGIKDLDYIPHILKYPKEMKEYLDTFDTLVYVSESRVDDNFIIYKIKSLGVKVPSGYEIVKPIEDVI